MIIIRPFGWFLFNVAVGRFSFLVMVATILTLITTVGLGRLTLLSDPTDNSLKGPAK